MLGGNSRKGGVKMKIPNSTKQEKCIFEEKLTCEGKDFCETCPVYYDWAVYFIFKKEEKEEEKEEKQNTKN